MSKMRLEGREAIDYAKAHGLTLNKFADPTEGAREGMSVDEANKVVAEDLSLIWVAAPLECAVDSYDAYDEEIGSFHG